MTALAYGLSFVSCSSVATAENLIYFWDIVFLLKLDYKNLLFSGCTQAGSESKCNLNAYRWKYSQVYAAAATAKSLQSCPTLWDPIEGSPPGSPVPGILQERTLEWVAIAFSNAWKWKLKSFSPVRLLATPWTAAYKAPPSMGFSKQEYWSGVPLPSPKSMLEYHI